MLPSLGERDLFRPFQLLPGVSGSNEASSGLYVRGGTPDQNRIEYDGFRVYQSALVELLRRQRQAALQSVHRRLGLGLAVSGQRQPRQLPVDSAPGGTVRTAPRAQHRPGGTRARAGQRPRHQRRARFRQHRGRTRLVAGVAAEPAQRGLARLFAFRRRSRSKPAGRLERHSVGRGQSGGRRHFQSDGADHARRRPHAGGRRGGDREQPLLQPAVRTGPRRPSRREPAHRRPQSSREGPVGGRLRPGPLAAWLSAAPGPRHPPDQFRPDGRTLHRAATRGDPVRHGCLQAVGPAYGMGELYPQQGRRIVSAARGGAVSRHARSTPRGETGEPLPNGRLAPLPDVDLRQRQAVHGADRPRTGRAAVRRHGRSRGGRGQERRPAARLPIAWTWPSTASSSSAAPCGACSA